MSIKNMKKSYIIIFIFITVACLFGWKAYKSLFSAPRDSTMERSAFAVPVEAAAVRKATIRDMQTFTGTLIPKAQFMVAPKISGRLKKLLVNTGDIVEHDQLIAVLDDAEYVQQVEQARADLTVAKANLEEQVSSLEIAQREFERIRTLHEKKIASVAEFDSTQAQLKAKTAKHKVAIAQVSEKEAALKASQVRLSYTQIRASWEDGNMPRVVGERFVDEGAMLMPNSPIVSILDINLLYAVIFAIERDYPKIRIGQEAIITADAYPERTFAGKIVRIAPVLKEESRQARIEVEVPNSGWLLKPGMFARIHIEFARHEDTTVVPVASLARRGNQQGIFLVDTRNMKSRFVPVTLGIINGELAEVLNPPVSGLVVTLGQHLLEDGSSINLPDKDIEIQAEGGDANPYIEGSRSGQ